MYLQKSAYLQFCCSTCLVASNWQVTNNKVSRNITLYKNIFPVLGNKICLFELYITIFPQHYHNFEPMVCQSIYGSKLYSKDISWRGHYNKSSNNWRAFLAADILNRIIFLNIIIQFTTFNGWKFFVLLDTVKT